VLEAMTFVLDASVAVSWSLPDEKGEATDAMMEQLNASEARVPALFWYEVHNVLLVAERRGRLAKRIPRSPNSGRCRSRRPPRRPTALSWISQDDMR